MTLLDFVVILVVFLFDYFVPIPYFPIILVLALIVERLLKGERLK